MKRLNVRQIWWSFTIHRFACVIKLNRGQKIRRLGASSKKVVVLGGDHHKMASPSPPPPPSCGQTTFFVGKFIFFFCLESPDTENQSDQTRT